MSDSRDASLMKYVPEPFMDFLWLISCWVIHSLSFAIECYWCVPHQSWLLKWICFALEYIFSREQMILVTIRQVQAPNWLAFLAPSYSYHTYRAPFWLRGKITKNILTCTITWSLWSGNVWWWSVLLKSRNWVFAKSLWWWEIREIIRV